ncbi:type II secretion system F family protein [Rhabdothermincola sp.]|uniref:type II secretion system F family protein n=1 Tax=Rhabdothermincola sp. TaxID=2820405 RepID=UPI002FE0CE30
MSAALMAGVLAAGSVVLPVVTIEGAARGIARARALGRLDEAGLRGRPSGGPFAWSGMLVASLASRAGRRRRLVAADRALPDWIEAAARAVRSGASLGQGLCLAVRAVRDTPLGSDVAVLARDLSEGRTVAESIDRFAGDSPSEARQLVCRALSLVAELGGPPGMLLDGISATLRDRLAAGREARALATQARASAVVMAAAPAAFAAVGAATDGRVAGFLVGSPLGLLCLVSGLTLEAAGGWWMARLVRSASA